MAVIAGSVETLVVGACGVAQGGEEGGAGKDTLGVVGMQPHLLPLVGVERSGLPPDAWVDRHPSHVVNQRRPPGGKHLLGSESAQPGGGRCQFRHAVGVANEEWRHQIG